MIEEEIQRTKPKKLTKKATKKTVPTLKSATSKTAIKTVKTTRVRKTTPKIAKKRTPSSSKIIDKDNISNNIARKSPRSFSKSYLILLFISAIILGAVIFFITHPLGEYVFHNPFQTLKKIPSYLVKKINATIFTPPKTVSFHTSFDYVTYQALSQHISMDNKEAIETFLMNNSNSSLSTTLRNKWLIFLAEQSHWTIFLNNYQPTNNQAVECYHLQALYHSGQSALALSGVKRLWLAGYKPSKACSSLFLKWRNSNNFKEEYLWDRLQQAINQNDTSSITQLTTMLPAHERNLVSTWLAIRKDPLLLTKTPLSNNIPNNAIGNRIIVDGLKQWANDNVLQAIKYWKILQIKYQFDEATSQDFYLTASLHLALNADPQAEIWFAKILPQYSTPQSRAWQVRFALMHQNWLNVLARIQAMPESEQKNNIWQYWKARALEKTGNFFEANAVYNQLSQQRQYYGFLAAYQQHKPLSIQQHNYPKNEILLEPYKQQIIQIQKLYDTHEIKQALQLTQDLLEQLNTQGQYTLAHLFFQWHWYSESMNIVNRLPYQSDLKLRFPMPHLSIILPSCSPTHIPPALVYAIGRQESNFHEDVFSKAGGLGILQLTLVTAQQFDPNITKQALYDPTTNIKISIAYLTKLNKQFDEHPALIASAYNAGPQTTRNWQPSIKPVPADIWIETRPWEETRNYLKNILAYYAVYEYLLGQTPNISAFMQDIPVNSH